MRLSTLFSFIIAVVSATYLQAQPVISNAEDFSIGTVLKFQQCEPGGVLPGNAGADQIWDFSDLSSLPDTTIETMVSPGSTPSGNDFPEANLTESYSDGRYVYVDKQTNGNYLVGFADPAAGLTIHYPNAMQFAVRPITFETNITDEFTISYSVNSLNFVGAGTVNILADGYGTLILPNATYENVLRLKVEQSRIDTLIEFQSTTTTYTVTYAWFDGVHTSSLLKIDSTSSDGFTEKSVEYLLQETTTGLSNSENPIDFSIYPNPAQNQITVKTAVRGKLSISDVQGRILIQSKLNTGSNKINIETLNAGSYIVDFTDGKNRVSRKLIVSPSD